MKRRFAEKATDRSLKTEATGVLNFKSIEKAFQPEGFFILYRYVVFVLYLSESITDKQRVNMKKLIIAVLALGSTVAFSSCEKCSTCTGTSDTSGETLTEEFCASGKAYDEGLDQYERANWTCKED